jgi:hypothetical protein
MTTQDDDSDGRERAAERRRMRLAEELRLNLQRRKAQGRARRGGRADEATGLPGAGLPRDQADDDPGNDGRA